MHVLPWFALAVSMCAAFTDARTGLIPNWLTLPSLVVAACVRAWFGGADALWLAALALVLVTAPNLLMFARGALGGGDVKLFAALAVALGPPWALEVELASLLLVSGWVLARALWRGQLLSLMRVSGLATLHLIAPGRFARPAPAPQLGTQVRMGPFIAIATLAACLEAAS